MVQPAVPELVEVDLHESLDARTESLLTLRQLGPPDLVHLVKVQPKGTHKEIGTYHHVTGIDASSSASLAAYINTLTYTIGENQIWFGKPQTWKIQAGTYCCYNAFSRVDMRVDVSFPGSVDAYAVDERGERRVATEPLWLETYLCSVLRAFAYAEDNVQTRIVGCRRFNPIVSTEAEHRFLDAAERLFAKGWQLGSDPEVQVPNIVANHLTTGILKYIHTTGRYTSGVNLFEKLRTRFPEVASLLARVLVDADEEVKAVQLLYETIKVLPMDHSLLDVQADFCQGKGRSDLALECAKRAVNSAPSEFTTWAKLAEIYIALEQYEMALLTLNSCPMFTYQERDFPRMPQPAKMHLPILPESMIDESLDEYDIKQDPLPAASLKGTFSKAYSLLTEIVAQVGWDTLLKCRSNVFVMEEEYRHEKNASTTTNASTTALRGNSVDGGERQGEDGEKSNGSADKPAGEDAVTNGVARLSVTESNADTIVEKPEPTEPAPEEKEGKESKEGDDSEDEESKTYTQFQNKRLCERWLDNLFMVLYEDLRVYTIWRGEIQKQKMKNLPVEKSASDWEIHGELAERLHHTDEAVEAYRNCLNIRFSSKAFRGLLAAQERARDVRGALNSIIRLTAWNYRWYSEFSPNLLNSVRKLIAEEGAIKFRSVVQSTNLPQQALDLTHHYSEICVAFRSSGSEM
ncbi:hypothetical protein H072_4432 [Dactylellina haptotyla CBS 200.50]|uniref:Uncharacterized protein n=1 Tax=Dactylellina haptotyla (strain CBS 200.50) TaxID=1284197 RepID=S8BQC9_DACHA|nr:hypothetical protein H072_4432 [Dactylellina haptotyla CBS 200.50]